MDELKEAGWNPIPVTVIAQDISGMPATVETAKAWKASLGMESDVLYDPGLFWSNLSLVDMWSTNPMFGIVGFPWAFYVSTAHMRVWDMYAGFVDAADPVNWPLFMEQQIDLLDYCGKESGVKP
ncbi:MAG: hypothetical protein GY854_34845 [Deltaproteobacteria bacterium]|nr:hypothetical protein [Deltaproteobacteria bacterium]